MEGVSGINLRPIGKNRNPAAVSETDSGMQTTFDAPLGKAEF